MCLFIAPQSMQAVSNRSIKARHSSNHQPASRTGSAYPICGIATPAKLYRITTASKNNNTPVSKADTTNTNICLHENSHLPDKCGIFDWRGIHEEGNYWHCGALGENALLGLFMPHAMRAVIDF
jgi:hypothetical protein